MAPMGALQSSAHKTRWNVAANPVEGRFRSHAMALLAHHQIHRVVKRFDMHGGYVI